ncbi:MAG TPA: class I SAM-dependent methyltransferase [Dehalococcoidia bacterium]|nr:class I SAM-dependent methyltransferase [Dehalococcoidia bacterium]
MEVPDLELPISDFTCCADLYGFPLVRALLGDSWHPGGLALTRAVVKPLGLSKDHRLLDVACGLGASALMLAQVHRCRVTGVDVDGKTVRAARQEALRYRLLWLVISLRQTPPGCPLLRPSSMWHFASALQTCSPTGEQPWQRWREY